MEKLTNLRSTKGIMDELEETVSSIKSHDIEKNEADMRMRGCKHAIQIIALSYMYAQRENIENKKILPHLKVS